VTPAERQEAALFVLTLAQDAAALIARMYEQDLVVSFKGKDDPVTEADRAANTLICAALGSRYPGMPIVAEESDPATYAAFANARAAWFVDPLDGTRDFVKKNGEFAVMVGLAEDGRATLGVIVMPVGGRAFVGGVDVPAFEAGLDGTKTSLHVSAVASLTKAELVVSRSRHVGRFEDAAAQFGVRKVTPCGSAGVKAARVATGEADVYAQPGRAGKLWDACAPEAIVVAAGGRVSDATGQPIDYRAKTLDNDRGLLVTNALLHAPMLELLRRTAGKAPPRN
jgi:3'(2'), 5'-bisphosphate nucleotidase